MMQNNAGSDVTRSIAKDLFSLLIVLLILYAFYRYAAPIVALMVFLISVPYLVKKVQKVFWYYYRRKCPKCGQPMRITADIVFDGAKNTEGGVGFPPVAYRLDSCEKCGAEHLKIFNPPGRRDNTGGYNALHDIADISYVEFHREAITGGGRLPRVHYITPEAHMLLVKLIVERVKRVNSISGYPSSKDAYKEFIRFIK